MKELNGWQVITNHKLNLNSSTFRREERQTNTHIHIHHPMFYQLIITTNNRETVFGNYDLYQEATNAVLDLINYHELSRNSKLTIITKGV